MSIKRIAKIIIFFLIIGCIAGYLTLVYSFPRGEGSDLVKERFNSFYAQPKNSLDGVYIGSSGVDRYWIPSLAYNNNGIAVYGLTSANQPGVFVKYLMKEVEKKQDVEFYLIDIRGIIREAEDIEETDFRRVTDNLRMSLNRFKAVSAGLDFVDTGETEIDTSDISFYMSLAKYHSRWTDQEMEFDEFTDLRPESEFLGYFAHHPKAYRTREYEKTEQIDEIGTIPEANKEVLSDLLDYCDKLDAEVIFLTSPQIMTTDEWPIYNYVFNVVEERGYETINFNTDEMYEKLDWNLKTDQYDSRHANIWGAIKYTNYLSNYLQDKFGLPDHRTENSDNYSDFIKAHEALIKEAVKHDPELEKLLSSKQ